MVSEKGVKKGGVRKTVKKNQKKRRADYEFPYLEPSVALISRKEETEDVASYMNKLPKEAKEWMNQFMKEEVNADLRNARFNLEKSDTKKIYDRNNARNRCDPRQNNVFVDQVPDLNALEQLLHPEEPNEEEFI